MRILLPALILFLPSAYAQEWWEAETQMEEGGKLNLAQKNWWEKASQLKVGEQLDIDSNKAPAGEGKMSIRRESRKREKGQEMFVWILDDDGDMTLDRTGDKDSDCYVVDYGCDGTVDRIVDYQDSDGDQIPNEMDIRYFVDGELRRSWFGLDLDGDGEMWDLSDYEYTGDFFASDPYDDNMIYMNKYNPKTDVWMPISECPFAFYDTDGNGASDVVVRFSAAPLDFSENQDPDFANSQARYQGPHYEGLEKMGLMNIRYSFDIDGQSSPEKPLHYEMGFNLIGKIPYEFPGMNHTQLLRRAPKTTVCCPHDGVRKVAETYPAEQTGFTWREFEDGVMKIGDPTRPEYDRRWEGVFWTWQRRIMHNTGGPVQDWNVRREFRPTPSDNRELYYSPVDRRIHLKGAKEGWIQVGHLVGDEVHGEIRMFDTDEDGYFDRWEHFAPESSLPVRVTSVSEAKNFDLGDDWDKIAAFYQSKLQEAVAANQFFLEVIEKFTPLEGLETVAQWQGLLGMDHWSLDERRYLLDLTRDYLYYRFQSHWRNKAKEILDGLPDQDPRSAPLIMEESTQGWGLSAALSEIDAAYGRGDYRKAMELLLANRKRFQVD